MKGNILVVDDNPDNLSALEQILIADGYKVRTATNGEIALKAAGARPPDLILLDIIMPGMDGFEVCRRLKGNPSTAGIPVLFISALTETGDKLMAFESGKGTGLGLSIVYGIIKQHKGGIMVCSEAGLGTTFNIYLPLIDRCAVDETSEKHPAIAGGTETILVAEDEILVWKYLKSLLKNVGYRVMVAVDGEEAMTMFEEHDDISLVLSDVVMPKKMVWNSLWRSKRESPA